MRTDPHATPPALHRRTVLGSLVGATFASLPANATAEAHDNPALVLLSAALSAAETAYETAVGAESDQLCELMHQLRRRIIETPARSMADVHLKVRRVLQAYGADDAEIARELREEIGEDSTVHSLALIIVLDLSRLSNGASR